MRSQKMCGRLPGGRTLQSPMPWGIKEKILDPQASWPWSHGLPAFSSVAICPNNYLKPWDGEVKHRKAQDEEKTAWNNLVTWRSYWKWIIIIPESWMPPWLQVEMKKPVKNKVCGHTYEEEAIVRMIESKHRRKKKAWWVDAGREVSLPGGGRSEVVCSR